MRTFRIILAGALAALGVSVLAGPADAVTVPASLSGFQQCQLQTAPYHECSGWTNGGLNNSNHYAEDMVVPQRAQFATAAGTDYVFSITYDFVNGTKHGYDYLATWNDSVGVNPCLGIAASLCSGTAAHLAMAPDATLGSHTTGIDRQWTLYGGTLISDTAPTYSGNQATVTVTFHATSSDAVLLFGGHLAVGSPATADRSWGNGNGASSFPGGSLSIRQTGSSRNNGINTGAIAPLPAAAFTIAKTATPAIAGPGDPVTYKVTVTNTGGQSGTATFTDDYDNNLTNVTTPPGCTQGTGSMTCATGSLAPQASQTFTYTANLPTSFTGSGTCTGGGFAVTNTATLASGTNVTTGTTGSIGATVCVNASPKFSITKTPRSSTAVAGGQVIYDVVVKNTGSSAGSTSFTDNYNDAASTVTLPSNCHDSTTTGGDKQFTCTTDTLAVGTSQTITYTMKMPATFTGTPSGCDNGGYPVVNQVAITGGGASTSSTVCVTTAAKFTTTKTPRTTTANAGDKVIYDVVVTNGGSGPGSTSFTDNYNDAASTFSLPSNCHDSTSGTDKKFTCTTGTINPGQSETISYTMVMPASFSGTPSGCDNGGYPVINQVSGAAGTASATVCVLTSPSFTTTKTPRTSTAVAGGKVIYDVVVTNGGSGPGSTSFTDNYNDAASTFSLPSNCHDTTSGTDKKFTCTTGTINPGQSETITYTMVMPASFTGTPSGCDNGGYPVINQVSGAAGSASGTVCVTASPSFSVTKTPSTDTASTNEVVTYTVVVHNGGSAPGTTSFTDNYDDSASTVTLPGNCHDTTTTGGDKQFTCTTGTINPGQSETITYTMRMPASFTGSPVGCTNLGYPVMNHITGAAGTADASVCVTAAPAITVVKTPRSTTAGPGDRVTYDVVVTNGGSAPGSTTFTDNIDDSASIFSLPANCTDTTAAGDKKFTCTTGLIDPGHSETVTYVVTMPTSFTGTPTGCDNGGYPVVNKVTTVDSARSSATVCINATPTLALAKTGSVAFDDNGDQIITYTISYANTGAAEANAVTITDPVPSGTAFVSCTGGCTTSGSPATATWTIGSVAPLTGNGSVQLKVRVTTNQACTISNTAQIRIAGTVAATSNAAVVNITPVPDPSTAKSSGTGIGVQVKAKGLAQLAVGLLNVVVNGSGNNQVLTAGQASSSQTGPGGPTANESHLLKLTLTGILSTGVIQETSSSVVTSAPAETRQTSTSEVASVCLVPVAGVCTVKSDTLRAVASTTATGSYASASAAGSTIENLYVAGVAVPVDLGQTTKIPLNAVLFGSNSYVAINEHTSSSGLVSGRYVADETVSMIHVKITNLALVGALDIVVAQATAHSEFAKTLVCSGSANQSVSGHALAAKLYTGPLLADLTQGYVQISPLGGAESQHIASVVVPSTGVAVNAQVADTSSVGGFTPTASTSRSWAEIAGDGTKPACVLSYVTNCVVKATLLRSEARSVATSAGSTSTDTGTSFVGLSVLGIPIVGTPAPNTTIALPGIGFVILNEQVCDNGAAASHTCSGSVHSGITVRSVRVVVTVLNNVLHLSPGVELTVAEAHADTTFGLS